MAMSTIEAKQRIEVEFWRDSPHESPGSDSLHNIINKISDAGVFVDCLDRQQALLVADGRVLELGGGQGWASCIYKKLFPNAHLTLTDLATYAVESLPKWERLLDVKIDDGYACKSYETDEPDASMDLIFCFAAAHHFLAHRRTLQEISRVLKPGAKAIYFYEPATPRYLHPLAYWRVNRKRPEVPEDVLIVAELRTLARKVGLEMHVDYYPSLMRRDALETVYYTALSHISVLQRVLPCTANFVFRKPSA